MNIFKISNLYNFLLCIIKNINLSKKKINGQSRVLTCVEWLIETCILKRREYQLYKDFFFDKNYLGILKTLL